MRLIRRLELGRGNNHFVSSWETWKSRLLGLALSLFIVVFPVVSHYERLVIDDRFQVDRAPPECEDVLERLSGIVAIQLRALVGMLKIELAVAIVVAVGHLQ